MKKKHDSILDFIPQGKQNAISAKRLAAIIKSSERQLREEIAALRASGELICSSSGGYYRPGTRGELCEFIDRMEAHAKSCFRAVKSARDALKQIEGQQSLTGI